ncbi:hypothetical protein HF521_014359 [Silurus meridionalis]|uniref:glutaminase n=1 Tax=Silurus meridionalis TaxID=175797 RepID=A0A8T0A8N2_SILME|nr:hypothetical protein HF521_014359 [Silurus meridionalis]
MLAENIPVPSSPVPIATIDLMPNSEVVTPSDHQEPKRPPRKTHHQEEQEDGAKPAWSLSVSPWVTIAFAIIQIRELIIMRNTHTHTEVQPLQEPDNRPPNSQDGNSLPGSRGSTAEALKSTGLRTGDPRLKECMEMLKITLKTSSDGALDRHLFKKCVQSNIVLLTQAFRKKFVIPDFQSFTSHIDELYESAKKLSGGQVADYIPQLAKFSSDFWAVSLCTVDGQRHTVGDTKVPFCLQSCVKPLKYAIAVHDYSTEYVHRFIGKEPSGLRFNKLFLDEDDKPHNPMVNAGAIVCTSLIKQGVSNAEKFDYVMNFLKKMAGNEYVGFSNATFQSERMSGDRNFAIGYYLKEKKCFPEGTDMTSILDFYFQRSTWLQLKVTARSCASFSRRAVHFGHHDVVTILQDYHKKYSPQESCTVGDKETAEKNLDGML